MTAEKPVIAVVGVADYPHGLATPFRMRMIGRTFGEAGWDPLVLVPYAPGVGGRGLNVADRGEYDGVPFVYGIPPTKVPRGSAGILLAKMLGFPRAWRELLSIARTRRVAAVVSYGGTALDDFGLWIVAGVLRARFLLEFCDEADVARDAGGARSWRQSAKYWLHVARERMASSLADGVLIIGHGLRKRLPRVADDHVFIMPILGDLEEWQRVAVPPPPAPPSFVWIGNFRPFEGLETLVEAAGILAAGGRDFRCRLYGRTDKHRAYADALAATLRERGLADVVTIHDALPREALLPVLGSATALLLPRPDVPVNQTNLPTKLIEFTGSGRPIVMTPVGEVRNYFTDGVSAVMAASDGARDVADAMQRVLDDPEAAERIGAAGRAAGKRFFDYRGVGAALREYLAARGWA